MKFKLKPIYNFQSVEFEFEGTLEELENEGMAAYYVVLKALKEATDSVIPPNTPAAGKPAKQAEPATPAQLKMLKALGIPTEPGLTKQEAFVLIKENKE